MYSMTYPLMYINYLVELVICILVVCYDWGHS